MFTGVKYLCVGAGLDNGNTQKHRETAEQTRSCLIFQATEKLRGAEKMTDEGEAIIVSADHNAGPQNPNSSSATGALVEVTFQKDPYQEQKYLEAEPKALGLTQIMLSLFVISVNLVLKRDDEPSTVIVCSLSAVGFIAGSVAIAAQNLHLPKLKACLGIQIVMCIVTVISFFCNTSTLVEIRVFHSCWDYHIMNTTSLMATCETVTNASDHMIGMAMLAQAAQIAISATLASYCCKVIQCCSPRTRVPMIVVNSPTAPQH